MLTAFSDTFPHQMGAAIGIFLVSAGVGFRWLRQGIRKEIVKDVWGIPAGGRGWYVVGGLGLLSLSVGCIIFIVLQVTKE